MTKYLNSEQRTADRPDECMDGIPGGIDPGYFVSKKFEEIENTSERDDPRLAEDFERLVIRRKDNPMLIDCETGDKDSQVKIDPGETGQAERNAQKVESFHAKVSGALRDCHLIFERHAESQRRTFACSRWR